MLGPPTAFHEMSLKLSRLIPASKLTRIKWARRRTVRLYLRDINRATLNKESKLVQKLQGDMAFELSMFDEEEALLLSERTIRHARAYDIPLPPPYNPDGSETAEWEVGSNYRQRYLTRVGRAIVRESIRKEKKGRFEDLTRWLPLITASTGLVGTVTGLVVAILSRKT